LAHHTKPRRRARRRGRLGLALAGGGPLGGIYEVGTLVALQDSLAGVDLAGLDVYVGVSSGGFVAAALANGISPSQMVRLFIDDGDDAALKPEIFMRPALREFAARARTLPGLALRALRQYAASPWKRGAWRSFATLSRALPTGFFDHRALDRFLRELFAAPGRSNDFRALRAKLFLVATHLDSGAPVTFGTPGFDHVPISRAIEASSALPGLFPPVTIDGAHYVDGALNKTLHASVALDAGADLLVCVNPLVPFDAARAARRDVHRERIRTLDEGGLPLVLAQTFRAVIHSRMKTGMEKYRRDYPHADVVLFEPSREDADIFFASIFSYAQRKRLCAVAYDATRESLRRRFAELAPLFAKHGIGLDAARLADRSRTLADALDDPRPLRAGSRRADVARAKRELAHVLDVLERHVAGAAA
jgi:predicted acylesterase/phospholipase RssA